MRTVILLTRLLVVTVILGTAVAVTWSLTADATLELARTVGSGGRPGAVWSLDHLMGDLASVLCLVAVLGLAVMSVSAVTAALAAERSPTVAEACARLTPRSYRRLVAALCGAGVAAPIAFGGSAMADGHRQPPACHAQCQQPTPRLRGLAYPDLPTRQGRRSPPTGGYGRQPREAVPTPQIVVRTGDSLWRIAERRLCPGASVADVATLTWHLYALNRSTIGGDPDLIFPGMTLIAPEGTS
jgi:LysM domain